MAENFWSVFMKNLFYNILFIIMLAGAVALTVLNLSPYARQVAAFPWYLIVAAAACLLAGAFMASFLSVLLHELGHMLFGALCGFKVLSFKLFGIETVYINGRRIRKMRGKDFCFGKCTLVPKIEDKPKKKLIITASGGLLFSLLAFLGYLLSNVLLEGISPFVYAAVSPGLTVSLYIFLSSFLPYRSSAGRSDGALIADLNKDEEFAAVMENLMRIQAQLYGGKSPAEIDRDLYFKNPMLSDDHATMFRLFYYRYLYYLDAGEFDKAAQTNRTAIELGDFLPPDEYAKLYLNACFDFILSGEREKAKACFLEDYEDDMSTYRIKAYYSHYVISDGQKVRAYIHRARQEGEIHAFKGVAAMEEKLLQNLAHAMEGEG